VPPKAKVIEAPVETGPAWTDRLIGHDAAEQAFLKAFAAGRLPHAWLISGPQGVGKATTNAVVRRPRPGMGNGSQAS